MPISITAASAVPADVAVLGVPVFADRSIPEGAGAELDAAYLERQGFEGRVGQTCSLLADDGSTIIAVGAGPASDVDAESLRRAAAALVRAAWRHESVATTLTLAAGSGRTATVKAEDAAAAVAEGASMASYRFTTYLTDPKPCRIERLTLVGANRAGLRRGGRIGAAVRFARDLVNTPAKDMSPSIFADIAVQESADNGVAIEIWGPDEIEAEKCGGLLGVSLGTDEEPRLLTLTYEPEGAAGDIPTVVLVGKGITFDSGGLSLKTADGMMTMKTDMGGAAAVLATLAACKDLGVEIRVVGICCLTENMPGPRAIKPGDVLRFRNGKTAEILNTDAEGRIVLADGLSLGAEMRPAAMVDIATLTGAQVVALGREIAGLMGNDEAFVAKVRGAADRAGEPMWPLPLPPRYRRHIDSEVADMKNIGNPGAAGTLVAGLFLKEFVGDTPWAHIDIAGPSRAESDDGYRSKGGTGFGTSTLIELLRSWT